MKTSCFAYYGGECLALKEPMCEKRTCPFYKTKEQIEIEYYKALYRKEKLGLLVDIVNTNNINNK